MNLKKTKIEMQKALQEALMRVDAKEVQIAANTSQSVNRRKLARAEDSSAARETNSCSKVIQTSPTGD
jgi:hypothetical protein